MSRKPKRKATIVDVAELVGVHHSTVSRALSPERRDKISPTVVKKVEKAAKKLGYFPNMAAASLKRNRSFVIGVLVPDLTNPVFAPIIRGIQDTAEAAGFTVITANTDDEETKEVQAMQMMQARAVEGMVIATAWREDPTVERCIDDETPFVLVNRTVDRDGVNAVVLDEQHGIRAILDHLISQGHSRIAHVAGPAHTSTGHHRAKAFTDYLQIQGLPADLVEYANRFTIEEGRAACERLLDKGREFTAIAAGNDLLALGCMDALADAGLTVPDDVSLTGYDDMRFLDRMKPALTTVSVPKYEMGAQAMKSLLETLDGKSKSAPVVLRMQPRLTERDSTGPASGR